MSKFIASSEDHKIQKRLEKVCAKHGAIFSHDLAQRMLKMPNRPVSCHEHGEILKKVDVDVVAANVGSLQCITLQFE